LTVSFGRFATVAESTVKMIFLRAPQPAASPAHVGIPSTSVQLAVTPSASLYICQPKLDPPTIAWTSATRFDPALPVKEKVPVPVLSPATVLFETIPERKPSSGELPFGFPAHVPAPVDTALL
jgi:hypothetical protein